MGKLIKLTSSNKLDNVSFYFKTIQECEDFKKVFRDHWTHVKWEKPEEVDEHSVPSHKKEYINRPPKERAESNLSWGFNSTFTNEAQKEITEAEEAFVSAMVHRVINGNLS